MEQTNGSNKHSNNTGLIIVLIIALLVSVAANVYQYNDYQNKAANYRTQITALKAKESKANKYDDICDALQGQRAGWSSDRFHASEGVIVLESTDLPRTFELIWDSDEEVEVNMNTTGVSATLEFSEETWEGKSTLINVTPNSPGITYVEFTSSVGNESFPMIVIVR